MAFKDAETKKLVRAEDVHGMRDEMPMIAALYNELAAEVKGKQEEMGELKGRMLDLLKLCGVDGVTVGDEGEQTRVVYCKGKVSKKLDTAKLVQLGVTQQQIEKATTVSEGSPYLQVTPPKSE
jgi:hypothetical protein